MNYLSDPDQLVVKRVPAPVPDTSTDVPTGRRENDFYPTPPSVIRALIENWRPTSAKIWEPCAGDMRFVTALTAAGYPVVSSDITTGTNFFEVTAPPADAICTNPPFKFIREFIYHAFAIGIREMAMVCPERLWACAAGRAQFQRHKPAIFANLDWREDYLGKGGSSDRALAVAIWSSPCAQRCDYQVWERPTDQIGLFGESNE